MPKEQGAQVVAITDSAISPIAGIADHYLTAKSSMASFVDSLVAPMSLINALIVAIGMRENGTLKNTLISWRTFGKNTIFMTAA
jgi:DNA-binding MurR/RpiR family transcriptional regulator